MSEGRKEAHGRRQWLAVGAIYILLTLPLVLAGVLGSTLADAERARIDPHLKRLEQSGYRLERLERRMLRSETVQMAMARNLATLKRELDAATRAAEELEKRHEALVTFVAKLGVKTNDNAQMLIRLRREDR